MKLLVLGGEGLLGKRIVNRMKKNNFIISSVSTKIESDLVVEKYNYEEIKRVINLINPNIIINTVALADINKCETDKTLAYELNVGICKIIAMLQKKFNFKIIHISTDQVYAGFGPHKEENVSPLNYYGETKLAGENQLDLKNSLIIRTNFFGKSISLKSSYTDWLLDSFENNDIKQVKISSTKFSPIDLKKLTEIIENLCVNYQLNGIYNIGSISEIDKLEFSKNFIIKKLISENKNILDLKNLDEFFNTNPTSIARPSDMRMNCFKFLNSTDIDLPNEEELMKNLLLDYN